jgi:hypothetical protein
MNERDVCEQLVERYGPLRARTLFGALRMLTLFGEDEVRRRGWLSASGLETIRRDLHLAGVPWPSPGGDRGA